MKNRLNLNNKGFRIGSVISMVLLLTLCIYGVFNTTKDTYAAPTLSGKWKWNDGELIHPGYNSGKIWINWGYTNSSGDCCSSKKPDDVLDNGVNSGNTMMYKDYKLSFTDANGTQYQSLTVGKNSRFEQYYVFYDTSYSAPWVSKDQVKSYPYLYYSSINGRTEIIRWDYTMYSSSYMTWSGTKSQYQTIDFGSTGQTVTQEFYDWFTANATEIVSKKCYYDSSAKKFVWTSDPDGKQLYSNFKSESTCKNGKLKLTIKDSSGNVQNCSSGSCASKTTEITLDLLPGTYQLNDTKTLKYKLERSGYKLTGWKVPTYNDGYTYQSGQVTKSVDGTLTFDSNNRQFTIEAKWEKLSTYTVSYNANGGSGAPASQTKTAGVALTLSSTIPTKSGYDFVKWKGSDGENYNPGGSYTRDANVTMTAEWSAKLPNTYVVAYNLNGGTGSFPNQTKTENVTLTLLSGKPTKNGHTFSYWSGSDGDDYDPAQSYTKNAKLTLTAVYTKDPVKYSLSYVNSCSGGSNSVSEYTEGTKVKVTVPSGVSTWKDAVGNEYGNGVTITMDKNYTLTAVCLGGLSSGWTITYNGNASGVSSVPASTANPTSISNQYPRRLGYKFNGWTTKANGGGRGYSVGQEYDQKKSITLYAQWIVDDSANRCMIRENPPTNDKYIVVLVALALSTVAWLYSFVKMKKIREQ